MKTACKSKWLRGHIPTQEQGFTLIELTVVVLIGGILAAIALPSLLSQTQKAQQAEAKTSLASLNRAQQAYFMETAHFTDQVTALGVGVKQVTKNYKYLITVTTAGTIRAAHEAESLHATLKPHTGMAALVTSGIGEPVVETVLCVADRSSQGTTNAPIATDAGIVCAPGTHSIARP